MNRSRNCGLEWERLRDGSFARLHANHSEIRRPGFALKKVAIAKMTEVSVVSAVFGQELLVFEPWVSVLLDAGDTVVFFGAYALAFPPENDTTDLPHICVRTGSWNKNEDCTRFECAEDKNAYIWSAAQIQIDLAFGLKQTFLSIKEMVSSLSDLVDQGLKRRCLARNDMHWRKVSVEVTSDFFSWKYAYSPLTSVVDGFEAWLGKWLDIFKNLAIDNIRAEDCEVSYRPCLMDRMPRGQVQRHDACL